jgi:hypothetical protein
MQPQQPALAMVSLLLVVQKQWPQQQQQLQYLPQGQVGLSTAAVSRQAQET